MRRAFTVNIRGFGTIAPNRHRALIQKRKEKADEIMVVLGMKERFARWFAKPENHTDYNNRKFEKRKKKENL